LSGTMGGALHCAARTRPPPLSPAAARGCCWRVQSAPFVRSPKAAFPSQGATEINTCPTYCV
jgi:hypothetical protein